MFVIKTTIVMALGVLSGVITHSFGMAGLFWILVFSLAVPFAFNAVLRDKRAVYYSVIFSTAACAVIALYQVLSIRRHGLGYNSAGGEVVSIAVIYSLSLGCSLISAMCLKSD